VFAALVHERCGGEDARAPTGPELLGAPPSAHSRDRWGDARCRFVRPAGSGQARENCTDQVVLTSADLQECCPVLPRVYRTRCAHNRKEP
jgi:hypothetical protein